MRQRHVRQHGMYWNCSESAMTRQGVRLKKEQELRPEGTYPEELGLGGQPCSCRSKKCNPYVIQYFF